MMGTSNPQPSMFYHINLEQFVTADHPMQKIRPLIDTDRIRTLCEPLYADTGRPSIPPEQLFLALLGGYLLGVTSERALVRELTGNLVLRWFVGLDLDTDPWDHSTFSQNRKRRFTESGLLEQLFDETVALAIKQKLASPHATLDGTLVQANASHKSFVPIEVVLKPEDYKKRIRSLDQTPAQDPGNPTVTFRGEPRSNQTHVSTTDPDAKLANKGNGTAAMVGYTVNGLMENRHRLLVGINVETFRGLASEMEGGRALIDTFHEKHDLRIQTVGADKGYFAKPFLTALFKRRVSPHIAAKTTGWEAVHQRVRRLGQTVGYRLAQRARKKIEELWGEAKCWHGFRRFRRRGLLQVRDEAI
ncbi:MAG: transposase [Nitrospirota bacterium]|nr:transposase [Nitrospirota bacterium]